MKRYIRSSSTSVDLSEEISIGKQCIDELRKLFPDIPARVSYKRGRAWSDCWYIDFYLQIPVESMARQHQKEAGTRDSKIYWDFIHDFEAKCKEVTDLPEFNNDVVRCSVSYSDVNSHRSNGAVLSVYALSKPSR